MPSKHRPISYRPDVASGLRDWLRSFADRTGRKVNEIINDALWEYRAAHDDTERSSAMTTVIDLYEDNGGNLIAAKDDGQPWLLGFNGQDPEFAGKFGRDAAAWAAGEWEPGEGDGQSQSGTGYETCQHVARWQDGTVTLTLDEVSRQPLAGFSASGYIGRTDDDEG